LTTFDKLSNLVKPLSGLDLTTFEKLSNLVSTSCQIWSNFCQV